LYLPASTKTTLLNYLFYAVNGVPRLHPRFDADSAAAKPNRSS
jgi:hypothetical protein